MEGYATDDEGETTVISSHPRTPPQLRRILRKLTIERSERNFIPIALFFMTAVEKYIPGSPLWLKRQVTISLLCEVDELDNLQHLFEATVAHLYNAADSGRLYELERRCCCCLIQ
jgi:hypothetical protein